LNLLFEAYTYARHVFPAEQLLFQVLITRANVTVFIFPLIPSRRASPVSEVLVVEVLIAKGNRLRPARLTRIPSWLVLFVRRLLVVVVAVGDELIRIVCDIPKGVIDFTPGVHGGDGRRENDDSQ
jgi:hypothetical protein